MRRSSARICSPGGGRASSTTRSSATRSPRREPPVRATIVYNNNPVAVCPDSEKVIAGFSREDLFTVVMDHFQTDTADYADIVLPATTQLEHYDVHKSYGHLYVLANNPAIAPVGESLPNSEVFRRLAARMGFDEPCFRDSDEDLCRTALDIGASLGMRSKETRLAASSTCPSASRRSRRAASRRRRASASSTARRSRSRASIRCRSTTRRRKSRDDAAREALSARLPFAAGAPLPEFLFANMARFREFEREPHLDMHPRRRRGARHPRRRPGARVQRPRQLPAARARQRQAAPGRGGRAFGVVEEVLARRRATPTT